MRKDMPVLRRLLKVSALMLGAGLVVTGCSQVKMGAAAIVGDQRITIATLDTQVTNLHSYVVRYPGMVQFDQAQETTKTLTWLVRFKINEELARQAGITVSTAQAQQALDDILKRANANAQAQGASNVTIDFILTASGIPPDLRTEAGRYQAIDDQFARLANGGQQPSTQEEVTAVNDKLNHATCAAAKALKIEVNPQFGRLDYSQYAVVASVPTVTRSAGPAPTTSPSGLSPAC